MNATTTQTTTPPRPTHLRTAGLRGSNSVPSTSARKSGASLRANSTLTSMTTKKMANAASPSSNCAQMRVQNTSRNPTSPNHSQSTYMPRMRLPKASRSTAMATMMPVMTRRRTGLRRRGLPPGFFLARRGRTLSMPLVWQIRRSS